MKMSLYVVIWRGSAEIGSQRSLKHPLDLTQLMEAEKHVQSKLSYPSTPYVPIVLEAE